MSEDWESVTKIGSKTRGGGGGPRETVIRGKGALNAAARSGGIIATEKKYATGNSATVKSSSQTGQFMTKVDRSDDIVKPKLVPVEVSQAIAFARSQKTPVMSQKELGDKSILGLALIRDWEGKEKAKFDIGQLRKIENALGVHVYGAKKGQPTDLALKAAKKAEAEGKK